MAHLSQTELLTIALGALIGATVFMVGLVLVRLRPARKVPSVSLGSSAQVVSIPPYSPQSALHRASSPRFTPPPPTAFETRKTPLASDETGPASAVTMAGSVVADAV